MPERETGRLSMSEGCQLRFFIDDTQPPDSINHHWAQTSYDGAPGSWVPVIGSHWHKHHDEYMNVLSGRLTFTMDDQTLILTPADPVLHIPRLHPHGFSFFPGEAAEFSERTDPPETLKEDFFRDIFEEGQPTFGSAMRAFYDGDTYPALPVGSRLLDQAYITVVGAVAKWMYPRRKAVLPSAGMSTS
ncbi:hypothetical protein LTR53_010422 [Teratosphaeriaceae sp. CCFEE 6253]|nr:hypothetical protein LTR53_010422 [Teratosphaeriaceae sp. CCFEE 6253]